MPKKAEASVLERFLLKTPRYRISGQVQRLRAASMLGRNGVNARLSHSWALLVIGRSISNGNPVLSIMPASQSSWTCDQPWTA